MYSLQGAYPRRTEKKKEMKITPKGYNAKKLTYDS
jgi:hypothetical protein